jgi:hypothetical protein
MKKLSKEEQVRVVACLVEGNSRRATVRMTGIHRTTNQKLLVQLGAACSAYQDKTFRNLNCKRVQRDEIWSFVYAKDKNVPEDMKHSGAGRVWTWIALDPDTKLVRCWFVSSRDAGPFSTLPALIDQFFLFSLCPLRYNFTGNQHITVIQLIEDAS